MITFVPVTRLGVRDVWRYVREGLEALIAAREEYWIPEEVFAELVAGKVTLYLMRKNDSNRGFFIARANADIDGPVMFIWIMWTEPYAFTNGEGFPLLDDMARSIGAKRIRIESGRKGWGDKGFELKRYVFEREVSHVSQDAA